MCNYYDARYENGHFLYRTGEYPYGREYILMGCGDDEKGMARFIAYEVFDGDLPYNKRDWVPVKGASTAPIGYEWYCNNKSRFSGEREIALLRKEKRHEKV